MIWHKCSDQMPPDRGAMSGLDFFLVYYYDSEDDYHGFHFASYSKYGDKWTGIGQGGEEIYAEITHWCKPEPPDLRPPVKDADGNLHPAGTWLYPPALTPASDQSTIVTFDVTEDDTVTLNMEGRVVGTSKSEEEDD